MVSIIVLTPSQLVISYTITVESFTVNFYENINKANVALYMLSAKRVVVKKNIDGFVHDVTFVFGFDISSPIKKSKRYVVNKSVMAFKKRGKEAYNEKVRKHTFNIYVLCMDSYDSSDVIKHDFYSDVINALKTAGLYNYALRINEKKNLPTVELV